MYLSIEECLHYYRKLIDLLEQDSLQMGNAVEGDLLEAYRKLLKKEITETRNMMQLLNHSI